ncbi:MAG TPA: 50S ribosomal protein L10 [SAR86 cluster bacterium]|jgi:large subunit ribosomal protein L10|nr:50S ribosomal protein L10 [SAR86 cluster bacterium]HJM59759.1 50S ribosomal protein L10 [SAR86 cluster bacterium]|tara:strand:+ start:4520 stop:5053 length:534 start_codon:yes stop_codon:yes gene_type:complete
MPMRIDDKKVAVEELQEVANKAVSAVAADYHGTSVAELTTLRKEARESGVHLKVIRNTLAKKALGDTKFSCFEDLLIGPTMLAFSLEDPTSAAKLVNNFSKLNNNFEVKGISLGDTLLELSRLSALANMPNKDQAISQLAGLLLAPMNQFASILNQVPSKLVRTLQAVKVQKEQAES